MTNYNGNYMLKEEERRLCTTMSEAAEATTDGTRKTTISYQVGSDSPLGNKEAKRRVQEEAGPLHKRVKTITITDGTK